MTDPNQSTQSVLPLPDHPILRELERIRQLTAPRREALDTLQLP